MSRKNSCPNCGKPKLTTAAQCGDCYYLSRAKDSATDAQCDGSGTMKFLCETLVPHVHCECGEPMMSPAELERGYCSHYCLEERRGVPLHCPFPVEHHGTSINHVLSQRKSSFKAQVMVFQHGQEMLSYQALNDLSWEARQRSSSQDT